MFNVNLAPLIDEIFKAKGYCWEFNEKMTTLRTKMGETLFELIYDEKNQEIIVLTQDNFYYATSITISVNGKKEPNLYMKLTENGKTKMITINVQND